MATEDAHEALFFAVLNGAAELSSPAAKEASLRPPLKGGREQLEGCEGARRIDGPRRANDFIVE